MSLLLRPILHELDVFLSFCWRDLSVTLISGSIWAFGALRKIPPTAALRSYLLVFSWISLWIYFSDLSNQITGVEEDRVNKPDRPIPSGKVTMAGAQRRWLFILIAFIGVALAKPTLMPATLCWIVTTGFLNFTPGGDHWFWKNTVSLSVGFWSLLQGSWLAVAPTSPKIEVYIYGASAWIGLIMQIQDLRDVKGDIAVGRNTLPIAFGDRPSRILIALVGIPSALYALYAGGIWRLAPVTLTVVHGILMYRVLRPGGARYDHKTYMFLTYIFCLILALTATEGMNIESRALTGLKALLRV